ncbi:MAG: BrnT family toxin [Sphingomonadaceae bacterium]
MDFEWDDAKRASNIARHGIDFIDAISLFDGRPVIALPSSFVGELRFLTTGVVASAIVTAVWTRRSEAIRIISVRRARDSETRAYHAHHHG